MAATDMVGECSFSWVEDGVRHVGLDMQRRRMEERQYQQGDQTMEQTLIYMTCTKDEGQDLLGWSVGPLNCGQGECVILVIFSRPALSISHRWGVCDRHAALHVQARLAGIGPTGVLDGFSKPSSVLLEGS